MLYVVANSTIEREEGWGAAEDCAEGEVCRWIDIKCV